LLIYLADGSTLRGRRPPRGVVLDMDSSVSQSALKLLLRRCKSKVSRVYFRAGSAFAMPNVDEYLEVKRIKDALPANQVFHDRSGCLLTRPVGRPPNECKGSPPISPIAPEAGPGRAG
jgi:hypothetical protein